MSLLAAASEGASAEFHAKVREQGLRVPEWRVLAILVEQDGAMITRLAKFALMEQSRLTRIIDQMIERGLVRRAPDREDGRRVRIWLTPDGRRRAEALADLVPDNPRRAYDMRKAVELIFDQGSIFETKPTHARNMVTAFARLEGRPVAIIGNNPMFLAGMLDAKAAEKAARHIAIADAFGLPLFYFIDMPGIFVGSGAEKTTLGLRSAKMLYELGVATVPRYSVMVRKGYGAGYYAMNGGRGFKADGTWAWPTSELCAMSIETALNVAYARDWQNAPDPAARKAELEADIRRNLTPLRAAEHFGVDDVIDPRDTRAVLADALRHAPLRPHEGGPPKKRAISPI